jgi:hypothetical protein
MILQLHQVGRIEMVVTASKPPPFASTESQEVVRFAVSVPNTFQAKIGASVAMVSGALTVVRIREGTIAAWNREHPDKEVKIGDRIVFANGSRKSDMVEALRTPGFKHLVFCRGPQDSNGFVLDEQTFQSLPETTISEEVAGSDACGICLEEWEAGERVVRLACGHMFHRGCCQQWLMGRSALCPLCQWAADCPLPGQPEQCCSKC